MGTVASGGRAVHSCVRPAALALVLAACAPADRSGTVQAWIFSRDPSTNAYALKLSEVGNLHSLRELRGRDIEVRRGTGISEGLRPPADIDRGSPFALEYGFDDDGAVLPGDLDSFNALSMYRNLDRAAALLREHGHVPARPLLVYFMPRYDSTVLGDMRLLLTDNAAYYAGGGGFLILPAFVLSDLPMMLNEGILAHEYGHAVVQQELLQGRTPEALLQELPAAAWRHLQATHEGVADLVGFCATGDPDYIAPTAHVDRDLSRPRDLTAADVEEMNEPPQQGLLGTLSDTYDPHHQGSLMARAVYESWPKDASGAIAPEERARLLGAVVRTLQRMAGKVGADFTLAAFPDSLAAERPFLERRGACDVLRRRFAPLADRFAVCGAL